MAEARLPSIASGNGRLLVTMDSKGEILSACWPSIDSPNQFATFSVQPAPGQAPEEIPKPTPPRYVDGTNISTSQSQAGLQFTDVVVDADQDGPQVDFLARKISGPHPTLRLLFQPNMDGRPGAQTIYWDEVSQALLAFCRRRWVAIGSSQGRFNGFHCGRLGSPSAASKFIDADTLPGERIAFREVDAILELNQSAEGTVILAVFGRTREEVLAGLNERREHQWRQFEKLAEQRAFNVLTESRLEAWTPDVTRMLRRSSLVWDVLTNRSTGGMIAGPDVQSGIASAPGYAAFWARDAAWAVLGTIAMGQYALSKSVLEFAWATQSPEGLWLHRHHTDHSVAPSWGLHQIDETGIILHCFKKYSDATGDTDMLGVHWASVEKAAEFLVRSRDQKRGIPLPSVDLWEEREGFHLYTAASAIAGLRAAVALSNKLKLESTAIERWTSVADEMQQKAEVQFWDDSRGRFISSLENSVALPMFDPERPELNAKVQKSKPQTSIPQYPNWRDEHVEAITYTHDISTIALAVPFGVLPLDDPRIVATVESIRETLWNERVGGLHRYENDSYGGGNPWPLATLWLAIYEAGRGNKEDARGLVEWVVEHSTVAGLVPEQVHRVGGHPVASVPLSWSHAMVAIAVEACCDDR
ncbi:Six-hairpin glycosidase-like protein [Dactylonectria estremocensis]|uniref:Six-hairpin glycosidase-like protein n=1 Tax=Dactylonectria estremocensis TaxID=1079267 RepID=A0A9P9D437_9HYPO|nr:Six-hairpin glycosidase-like protein [Dactylonectria estremocensis]